jgi:hypothetical protein
MKNEKGSILKIVLIIIGIVLVLSAFNINIRAVIESPRTKENIAYVTHGVEYVWGSYLKKPFFYLLNLVISKQFSSATESSTSTSTPSTTKSSPHINISVTP